MAPPLTAQRAVTRLQRRIADRTATIWSAAEILEAMSEVLQPIYTSVKCAGSDHGLDKVKLTVSSAFTNPEEGIWEYSLPEQIGAVRRVEGIQGSILRPFDIDHVDLNDMHAFRGFWDRGFPIWTRGVEGVLRIVGRLESFDSVQVWYVRKWPDLHYGAAQAASGGAAANKFRFAASPTGRVIQRDDVYNGMQVEFSSGSHVDALRRISDYDAATGDVTLASALGSNITTETYSLVVPLDSEHTEFFMESMLIRLLEETGNDSHIAVSMGSRFARLEERFHSGLRKRDTSRSRRVRNRRSIW